MACDPHSSQSKDGYTQTPHPTRKPVQKGPLLKSTSREAACHYVYRTGKSRVDATAFPLVNLERVCLFAMILPASVPLPITLSCSHDSILHERLKSISRSAYFLTLLLQAAHCSVFFQTVILMRFYVEQSQLAIFSKIRKILVSVLGRTSSNVRERRAIRNKK